MAVSTSSDTKQPVYEPGMELKLQNLKFAATEEGQYKDDAFLDRDDDGRYPKRNGKLIFPDVDTIYQWPVVLVFGFSP